MHVARNTIAATDLAAECRRLRVELTRLHAARGGHLGSALSVVEILVAVLDSHFRWGEPGAGDGDRFLLSKGHAAMALYCWARMRGLIPEEVLATFNNNGSTLEPHPNERNFPWIHASSGSLGQGLSIGVGFALADRLRGSDDRTFVVIGDGECNEGQIWEAARSAAHLGLSNLVALLDDNGMQQDGPTGEILPVDDIVRCWTAMGWSSAECDGHDCDALSGTLTRLIHESPAGRPRLLRAVTVKGRGVDFLEGQTESHYPPPLSPVDLHWVHYALQRQVHHGTS